MSVDTTASLGRTELLDLDRALQTEWALRNRVGATAAGTALGANTRPEHGLLTVPSGDARRLLVSRVEEEVELADGERISLSTNEYHDGTIHPSGYLLLEEVSLGGSAPTWRWRAREIALQKTVVLAPGRRAVAVRYLVLRAPGPVPLRLTPLLTDRDAGALTVGAHDWRFSVDPRRGGCVVRAWDGGTPVWLSGWTAHARGRTPARVVETGLWYWQFLHRHERWVGRPHLEDLHAACLFSYSLREGEAAWLVAGADDEPGALERLHPEHWLTHDSLTRLGGQPRAAPLPTPSR
jgi:predicted glycogen debranching enzyme